MSSVIYSPLNGVVKFYYLHTWNNGPYYLSIFSNITLHSTRIGLNRCSWRYSSSGSSSRLQQQKLTTIHCQCLVWCAAVISGQGFCMFKNLNLITHANRSVSYAWSVYFHYVKSYQRISVFTLPLKEGTRFLHNICTDIPELYYF